MGIIFVFPLNGKPHPYGGIRQKMHGGRQGTLWNKLQYHIAALCPTCAFPFVQNSADSKQYITNKWLTE